jgi:MFS transporter, ACS family, glucarate transporter
MSDHPTRTRWFIIALIFVIMVGLLLAAGWICAGAAATDPYLAVLFLSFGAGSLFVAAPAYFATTIDLAKKYAGTVGGFMNTGGNLGGALSPTLTPFLAQQFGWDSALYAAAGLALFRALFWLGVHPERAIDLGEETLPHEHVVVSAAADR